MTIYVTPEEMIALRDLELECYDGPYAFNEGCWLEGCRAILGDRCPAPYSPPVAVEVVW